MSSTQHGSHIIRPSWLLRIAAIVVCALILMPAEAQSRKPVRRQHPTPPPADTTKSIIPAVGLSDLPDSIPAAPTNEPEEVVITPFTVDSGKIDTYAGDTIPVVKAQKISEYDRWEERPQEFNPSPTRAAWLSALFPGLGQVYNRRYWKLPIVIGAYVGLGYGCSWNNSMLNDYTRAYRDIMDTDPTTKSYMDFFPPTTKEEDLDKTWLTNVLKSRKDFYRRNRDLCIIAMVGMYFIAMVDAYVDASLSHFDISPDLSMDIAPAVMKDSRMSQPALGVSWALTF